MAFCLTIETREAAWRETLQPAFEPASRAASCHPLSGCVTKVHELKTVLLFLVTAVAEIVGCYLPYLWLRGGKSAWLLVPATLSLALFAWLLSLHPTAAGRVYAAYGGVYVAVAILWLWLVDGIRPSVWDIVGSVVALAGMAIIMFAPKNT